MEPIVATIVTALAAGAAAASKDVATQAIKDAYAGLKSLLTERFGRAAPLVEMVEEDPTGEHEQALLAKQLQAGGAGTDAEVEAKAKLLLEAVESIRGLPAADALFDFDRLRLAKDVKLEDIEAVGTVFRARDADIGGSIEAKGIRQTGRSEATEKK